VFTFCHFFSMADHALPEANVIKLFTAVSYNFS
jgi:hypothetical protein